MVCISSVNFTDVVSLYVTHRKRANTLARTTVRTAPVENSDLDPFVPSSPEIKAVCMKKIHIGKLKPQNLHMLSHYAQFAAAPVSSTECMKISSVHITNYNLYVILYTCAAEVQSMH